MRWCLEILSIDNVGKKFSRTATGDLQDIITSNMYEVNEQISCILFFLHQN